MDGSSIAETQLGAEVMMGVEAFKPQVYVLIPMIATRQPGKLHVGVSPISSPDGKRGCRSWDMRIPDRCPQIG